MEQNKLIIRGARVHNLKNIDVEIPRDKLTVITGISGSGKSSLAFDAIHSEGQRRYLETLSAYSRQFVGTLERPDVDRIDGLNPTIAIEQKIISKNPRSTVGTVTEIYDYIRLLFAQIGIQFCYQCNNIVEKQSTDQIIDEVMEYKPQTILLILAPVVRGRKGHYRELFEEIAKDGFLRVRVDGDVKEIYTGLQLKRYQVHDIEIVVDRILMSKDIRSRVADSIELALNLGSGVIIVNDGHKDRLFSQFLSCLKCGISYEEPAPNSFSFNSPYGACPSCKGLGEQKDFDVNLIFPDDSLTINQEAIAPLGKPRDSWLWSQVSAVARRYEFDFNIPLRKIPKKARDVLLWGGGDEKFEVIYKHSNGRTAVYKHRFNGLIDALKRIHQETNSPRVQEWIESYMISTPCTLCNGGRLKKASLAIKLPDVRKDKRLNIHDIVKLSIGEAYKFFESIQLSKRHSEIAHQIIAEVIKRLGLIINLGLHYITLDRPARTLSCGEAQRIRLATQIGSQLVGVLYILDEPSIGLHQRDNLKLIESLHHLRKLGNTVIVVEHDREMIERADYVIDLGPGAGEFGGYVVATGQPNELKMHNQKDNHKEITSLTGLYLTGEKKINIPRERRRGSGKILRLVGCRGNNLKSISVSFPLGKLICVTGVSGSGKSSLISETLYRILARKLYKSKDLPLPYTSVSGLENIDKVIEIDQSPIGRTPRSNPATYTGLFTYLRDLFIQLPEAKLRNYRSGRFSFNVKDGRCEECRGMGIKKIEMNFLPDVYVTCDECKGARYNQETLEIKYRGKSIADILEMTVTDALAFFNDVPYLSSKLSILSTVGLGYIKLGQPATTLSGGEAQRVKLSTELSKVATGKTLYILDEPTTGLHFEDVRMLISLLNQLVNTGNTVIIIEHNMDVIKTADWIIDLGPEGGDGGGWLVAEGTPEQIAQIEKSFTGYYLKRELAA